MNISMSETLQITISSMLIVFIVLVLLMFIVSLFKYIPEVERINANFKRRKKHVKYIPFEEMDEDMQVAVLVATINYQQKTKNDVVLKSVRKL